MHEATISVACEDGTATLLRAGAPTGGRYRVTLDRPIDIAVAGWRKRTLAGVAADGRQVTLEIEPSPKVDAGLDIDLLFDHSGSMSERAAGDREIAASKFEVARDALDIDLLFDHSGSMSERAAGDREIAASKFEVARDALAAVARDRLTGADRIGCGSSTTPSISSAPPPARSATRWSTA